MKKEKILLGLEMVLSTIIIIILGLGAMLSSKDEMAELVSEIVGSVSGKEGDYTALTIKEMVYFWGGICDMNAVIGPVKFFFMLPLYIVAFIAVLAVIKYVKTWIGVFKKQDADICAGSSRLSTYAIIVHIAAVLFMMFLNANYGSKGMFSFTYAVTPWYVFGISLAIINKVFVIPKYKKATNAYNS